MANCTPKEVSIVSFQTIVDAIDPKSPLHEYAKLFFATLAVERAKNLTIRKHYAYLPKPVLGKLLDIIWEVYEESKKGVTPEIEGKIDLIMSILSGVEMDKFELDEPLEDSPFELGRLLNDEADTNINIVMNEKNAEEIRTKLSQKHAGKKMYPVPPINTNEWIAKHITP